MPPRFKIAIVGEAWGDEEAQWKMPFIGPAGKQLDSILEDAGIVRAECFITNVFNLHPAGNKLETLCVTGKNHPDAASELYPLIPGKYLKKEYMGELDRLHQELREVQPNLAILCGNTPCWALLGQRAISKIRGTASVSSIVSGLKCLPVYHPAAVLRQYDLRHVTVLDFQKAKREGEFPELRRPIRRIEVAESLSDIIGFLEKYLRGSDYISCDIETAGGQITCIGFAPGIDRCLVIPFWDSRKPGGSYWPSLELELAAWDLVQTILRLPAKKLGQNFLYDVSYLWFKYGIEVTNIADDTMLLHHALQPEENKGLGFLGSVYCNEPAWKAERARGKKTLKREDD